MMPTYVGAKVYYDVLNGAVLQYIQQQLGGDGMTILTREDDFRAYKTLRDRVPESVGLLQFDYGDYESDYDAGGVITNINLETMEPHFEYPDPADPETPQEPRPALSEQVDALMQDNTLLKAQSKALAERAAFTDDVIAEIAIEVYG
ncbi:hypothetical protein MKY85_17495 [Paenibacillus sp. FSL R5-0749]|uniref:hypothetical protein n=1 Tax=Paenibacillus sp. FSL R5-0749 TaxID=2921657 RepID=UPI00315AF864